MRTFHLNPHAKQARFAEALEAMTAQAEAAAAAEAAKQARFTEALQAMTAQAEAFCLNPAPRRRRPGR